MKIRDRIKELRRVKASELLPSPKNWRTHPRAQEDALRGVLAEIGWADAVLARETPDGLVLIDGHLRGDVAGEELVPVLVLDVDDAEADVILATHDPLAALAEADEQKLGELLASIQSENSSVRELLDDAMSIDPEVRLERIDVSRPPPAMTWALIGLPTVRWGEIAEAIDGIASTEGIILEMTANDGEKNRQQ